MRTHFRSWSDIPNDKVLLVTGLARLNAKGNPESVAVLLRAVVCEEEAAAKPAQNSEAKPGSEAKRVSEITTVGKADDKLSSEERKDTIDAQTTQRERRAENPLRQNPRRDAPARSDAPKEGLG